MAKQTKPAAPPQPQQIVAPATITLDTRTVLALLQMAANGARSDAEKLWVERLDLDLGKGILAYAEQVAQTVQTPPPPPPKVETPRTPPFDPNTEAAEKKREERRLKRLAEAEKPSTAPPE